MSKGSMSTKRYALGLMYRDGISPSYILEWNLPRIPLRDLQLIHEVYLRDRNPIKAIPTELGDKKCICSAE